ncbi:MAG: double zinc ribbon domain-containing protein [Actinomycetota bacterium]
MLQRALDVVFPPRCAGCGTAAWPFCDRCRSDLIALSPPWCDRCGAPSPGESVPSCRECPPDLIAQARAPFAFEGPARQAVHHLKYRGVRGVGRALGAAMATTAHPRADVVTWVPLTRRRKAERGFDQAKVLAVEVGRHAGVPVRCLLRRVRSTGPQAKRDAAERREAMRGSFVVRDRAQVPQNVLLVDDVLTTGATAAACAEALLGAGASQVMLVVAARALLHAGRRAYTRPGPRPGLWLPGDHPR